MGLFIYLYFNSLFNTTRQALNILEVYIHLVDYPFLKPPNLADGYLFFFQ